jgi:hypothetical protein
MPDAKTLTRLGVLAALVTLLIAGSAVAQGSPAPNFSGLSTFDQRALVIMDPKVVADPVRTANPCNKPASLPVWSFGSLMKEMANGDDAAAIAFIQAWLQQFMQDQTINGQTVGARDIKQVWQGWQATGFDLKQVPFQLLAIVNRIDLLNSPTLGGENAGEVRFVFGAVDLGDPNCGNGIDFTVILEYGARQSSCADLRTWAQQWVALAALDPSNPASGYLDHLQAITDTVTWRGKGPTKPNGSAIDHVRTNEALDPRTPGEWQMREFAVDGQSHQLVEGTVTLTPINDLNGTTDLTQFLDSIAPGILSADHDFWIPRRFPRAESKPLLGATAIAGTTWQMSPPPPDPKLLQNFALNTCSGCHGGVPPLATSLTQIDPVAPHDISPFLLAEVNKTPVQGPPNREQELQQLADPHNSCSGHLPHHHVH